MNTKEPGGQVITRQPKQAVKTKKFPHPKLGKIGLGKMPTFAKEKKKWQGSDDGAMKA